MSATKRLMLGVLLTALVVNGVGCVYVEKGTAAPCGHECKCGKARDVKFNTNGPFLSVGVVFGGSGGGDRDEDWDEEW